jgi:hypothetical protein
MVDKECTYLFHWSHSLDKHTKQLIRPNVQDEHKAFCHQYKNAKFLGDVVVIMFSFVPNGYHLGLFMR